MVSRPKISVYLVILVLVPSICAFTHVSYVVSLSPDLWLVRGQSCSRLSHLPWRERLVVEKPKVVLNQRKTRSDAIESEEVLQRQRKLTDAMNLLSKWDEEQTEFVLKHADPNAPLGDWRGLRKVLTEDERSEMQKACKLLCEDAAYVLLGLNAETENEARIALGEWIEGLGLPVPESVPYMDDVSGLEYSTLDDMPPDFRALVNGPVHIAYNSKADADPVTGDDSNAPSKGHLMPYPAPDRGVVFTPILEGFFTQYGDVPLDLFSPLDAASRQSQLKAAIPQNQNLATMQHASLGNPEAAKLLLQKFTDTQPPPSK